jgi:hypothetical protein
MRGTTGPTSNVRSRENKRTESSSSSFRFVNAVPDTEEERISLRSAIRANATRYQWRQSRVARVDPALAPPAAEQVRFDRSVARHEHNTNQVFLPVDREATFRRDGVDGAQKEFESGLFANSQTLSPFTQYDYALSSSQYQYQYRGPSASKNSRGSGLNITWESSSADGTGSPANLLGSGVVDPFDVHPPGLPREVLGQLLCHSESIFFHCLQNDILTLHGRPATERADPDLVLKVYNTCRTYSLLTRRDWRVLPQMHGILESCITGASSMLSCTGLLSIPELVEAF